MRLVVVLLSLLLAFGVGVVRASDEEDDNSSVVVVDGAGALHINSSEHGVFINGVDVTAKFEAVDTLQRLFQKLNDSVSSSASTPAGEHEGANLAYMGLESFAFESTGVIPGDIDLSNNLLTAVDFGQVTKVGGSVNLASNHLQSISFKHIGSIRGSLAVNDNELTAIDFASLSAIHGSLNLDTNLLVSIDFKNLTRNCRSQTPTSPASASATSPALMAASSSSTTKSRRQTFPPSRASAATLSCTTTASCPSTLAASHTCREGCISSTTISPPSICTT